VAHENEVKKSDVCCYSVDASCGHSSLIIASMQDEATVMISAGIVVPFHQSSSRQHNLERCQRQRFATIGKRQNGCAIDMCDSDGRFQTGIVCRVDVLTTSKELRHLWESLAVGVE